MKHKRSPKPVSPKKASGNVYHGYETKYINCDADELENRHKSA